MLFANSLIDGFFQSNMIGQVIVWGQVAGSIIMFTIILGKWRELRHLIGSSRRFKRDFDARTNVLEYYMQRRPTMTVGMEGLYKVTCDQLLKQLTPDVRALLVGRETDGDGAAALTGREIELVRGTCEHQLDEEELRYDRGMGLFSSIVTLEPMLGLLGTVWGVLDAFAEMGTAGSANLATIAPSISAALVTTVVGLLVAIPGVVFFNIMNSKIRNITSDMEGFADELMGRIACEFQGRGA